MTIIDVIISWSEVCHNTPRLRVGDVCPSGRPRETYAPCCIRLRYCSSFCKILKDNLIISYCLPDAPANTLHIYETQGAVRPLLSSQCQWNSSSVEASEAYSNLNKWINKMMTKFPKWENLRLWILYARFFKSWNGEYSDECDIGCLLRFCYSDFWIDRLLKYFR